MTKFEALGPFAFVPTKGQKACSVGKSSLVKTACIVFVFCVAAAIASPAQTLTTLFSFDRGSSINGYSPVGSLVQGVDGNFYGTTAFGGDSGCTEYYETYNGCGTVFKITPGGTLTTLHSFDGSDGAFPLSGGLVQASDGNFYGTTTSTVFKITAGGAFATLHIFDGTDGAYPEAGLVQGTDGNFYGTTSAGGLSGCGIQAEDGCGTIFKITAEGAFATLHIFDETDGYGSLSGLVQGPNGNFYGTAYYGGVNCDPLGCGTVFKIAPGGTLRTLHTFNDTVGTDPYAGLVGATDGNLYGTTTYGGANANGTIFKITPSGTLTTLHSFDGTDGTEVGSLAPVALIQATDGNFYGVIGGGGAYGDGTVYRLSTGLGPFVSFLRSLGTVGRTAQILGQGFTGTTSVSFNGTPAAFTVESDTYLTAVVPAGASTGVVTVTTPGGTLTSNKTFRVVPQIKSFSPTNGPVSTSVVITGESFIGVIDVHFGNVKVTSFTVDSDTQITATVPAGAETGKISVCTSGG
ncbi:MAG: choice-of-anchor tandem repeat GloVer-containing protein, partial [Candidatus Sulfotelmatobacter sp.]